MEYKWRARSWEDKLSDYFNTIYWISFFTDWNHLLYHKLNSSVYWGMFLGCLFCSIYLSKSHTTPYFIDPLCEPRTEHWFIIIIASTSRLVQTLFYVLSHGLPHFLLTATFYSAYYAHFKGRWTKAPRDKARIPTYQKDGDCSHEIKRHLLLGRKAMTNLVNILKSRAIICQQRSI